MNRYKIPEPRREDFVRSSDYDKYLKNLKHWRKIKHPKRLELEVVETPKI